MTIGAWCRVNGAGRGCAEVAAFIVAVAGRAGRPAGPRYSAHVLESVDVASDEVRSNQFHVAGPRPSQLITNAHMRVVLWFLCMDGQDKRDFQMQGIPGSGFRRNDKKVKPPALQRYPRAVTVQSFGESGIATPYLIRGRQSCWRKGVLRRRRSRYGVEIAAAQAPRNDNLLDSEQLPTGAAFDAPCYP